MAAPKISDAVKKAEASHAAKGKASGKPQCEIKSQRACNGQAVRKYTGLKKGDPVFRCCIGCWADLKRSGVRMKEVTA